MGCLRPAARRSAALAPAASIVFKYVLRFILSPSARRSLIKLPLTRYGELDPVQAGMRGDVERFPIITPIAVRRRLRRFDRAQVLSGRREHPDPARAGSVDVPPFI